jgi:hypothetical protein
VGNKDITAMAACKQNVVGRFTLAVKWSISAKHILRLHYKECSILYNSDVLTAPTANIFSPAEVI